MTTLLLKLNEGILLSIAIQLSIVNGFFQAKDETPVKKPKM